LFKKSLLGIDIGSCSIKLVELDRGKDKYLLKAISEMPIPVGLVAGDSEESLQTASNYIKKLIADSGSHTKDVVSVIPSDKVSTASTTLPVMPKDELEYAMKWEIKKQISGYPEDKTVNWEIVDQRNNDYEIFMVAASRSAVAKYLDLLKRSGLNPVSLDIEPVALIRSLITDKSGAFILVHIGARFSTCDLVENGILRITRNLKTGENAMLQALKSITGDPREAKKILYDAGFFKTKEKGTIYNLLRPSLGSIISEIQRLATYFQEKNKREVSKIIISGGCTSIPNIVDYLSQNISMEINIANPWVKLDCSFIKDPERLVAIGPRFAVAVGLAMY